MLVEVEVVGLLVGVLVGVGVAGLPPPGVLPNSVVLALVISSGVLVVAEDDSEVTNVTLVLSCGLETEVMISSKVVNGDVVMFAPDDVTEIVATVVFEVETGKIGVVATIIVGSSVLGGRHSCWQIPQ